MSKHTLDARRLLCPLPVIRLQDKVKTCSSGDEIEMVCTDPGTLYDIPAWCRMHGHQIVETVKKENEIYIKILLFSSKPM